jgi:hypothetical protein
METKIREITSIEKKLDSILRPVNPEEGYVANLKNRLLSEPDILIERPNYLYVLLLFGSLLFFGAFFVWLINRFVNRKFN